GPRRQDDDAAHARVGPGHGPDAVRPAERRRMAGERVVDLVEHDAGAREPRDLGAAGDPQAAVRDDGARDASRRRALTTDLEAAQRGERRQEALVGRVRLARVPAEIEGAKRWSPRSRS